MAAPYTYEQLKDQVLKKLNAKPDTQYLLDKYVKDGGSISLCIYESFYYHQESFYHNVFNDDS